MKKYKLIFIFLYYYFSGLHFSNQPDMNRPLASFSILSQVYYHQQPKPTKPNVAHTVAAAASSPVEKQKFKITIVAKKSYASTAYPAPVSHVPVPPSPVSPSPVSPRT